MDLLDDISSALGVPTSHKLLMAKIMVISIILIWIGSSMVMSKYIYGSAASYKTGGILTAIGVLSIIAMRVFMY